MALDPGERYRSFVVTIMSLGCALSLVNGALLTYGTIA